MSEFTEGQRFTNPAGALVRIDRVTEEWVYYVSWRAGAEVGSPLRMNHPTFREALKNAGMNAQADTQEVVGP
jgi:hypothetical protein